MNIKTVKITNLWEVSVEQLQLFRTIKWRLKRKKKKEINRSKNIKEYPCHWKDTKMREDERSTSDFFVLSIQINLSFFFFANNLRKYALYAL